MISKEVQYDVLPVVSQKEKLKQYWMLLKPRLSFLVVFSGAFGYLLGIADAFSWTVLGALVVGSFLITGAANIINQVIEKDLDKLMSRTKTRPLPTGKMSVQEAILFSALLATVGSMLLGFLVNPLVAGLSMLSLILYAFVYTPLKQVTPISVFVGAFPGAMPPLIGWAAATESLGFEAFILFAIQFIWQFPHFWAIAWVGHEDYSRAGFRMLPSKGGRDLFTAIQISVYTLFLIPVALLPAKFGLVGITSAIISVICGVLFLMVSLSLIKNGSKKAAMRMMFASFFYLPIVQIAFLVDKL